MKRAIELDFPFEIIDEIAEIESYRKEINRPIYHIHKWWAKRLGSVFRAIVSGSLSENDWVNFYEYQNYAGKVVLDPFMGAGTTLGESLKLGAKVIGCDVNPVSTFIVKQALTSVNLNDLETEFKAIETDVKNEILSFYTTKVPGASRHTPALYYFWVKIVSTPNGEDIPLFSSYVFSKNAYPNKKPESQIWCPLCENIFIGKYNSTDEQCPECSHLFNPQHGAVKGAKVFDKDGNEYKIKDLINSHTHAPNHKLYAILALNEQGEKVYIKPTEFDHELFNRAKKRLEELKKELPLPTMAIRSGYNTKQAKGYNYHYWLDFFNERQLLCLGILLRRILKIENRIIRDQFVCLFSGTLEFNNLFCSFKGEGTGAVRHLFSHHILKPERTPLENTVWGVNGKSSGTFSTLFKSRLLKAKTYLDHPFEIMIEKSKSKRSSKKVVCSAPIDVVITEDWESFQAKDNRALVLNGDSSRLDIPDSSVDAIVTDPPYFDFIHYSELSDFFYAWLSKALSDEYAYLSHQDSSHKNEVQDKDYQQFSYKISKILAECYRVLKTEGLMCFSYHHSTIDGWIAIYNAVTKAEFYIVAAHPVKAEMSVSTPKSAAKEPINLDTILICKKQNESSMIKNNRINLKANIEKYVQRFYSIGRNLSSGDKFVIACSQVISFASCNHKTEKETKELLQWVSNESIMLNQT